MRYRRLVFVPVLLMASATIAQTSPSAPPRPPDRWAVAPAASGSVDYRSGRSPTVSAPENPFKFRDPNEGSLLNLPPPRPMDRAAVMGTGRAWSDGRPPLDCAQTPMDAKCH
jgi:hypothetical protein